MRFQPYGRFTFEWTERKAAAAIRRLQRERDAYPLFSDQIAQEQPSLEVIKARRIQGAAAAENRMRALQAQQWRRLRADFFTLPEGARAELMRFWNAASCFPGRPVDFAYVLRRYRSGGLALPAAPKTTAAPEGC